MTKKTIRRNPMSVNVTSLNEKYFNFYKFDGINSNKNYVGVSQYSFEEADNVYVDQNNQLHTRPPIKSINIDVFSPEETPVDIIKVNNITFYKTFDGSSYKYHFKYDKWYACPTTEKSLVYFLKDTFFVFNEDGIYAFQYNDGTFTLYVDDSDNDSLLYVPITKVVSGNSVTDNESENLFTTSQITRYLFEHDLDAVTNTDVLNGKSLTVVIDGKKYNINFKQGNQIVFASKVTNVKIPLNDYNNADCPGAHIHYSLDGKILVDYISDDFSGFYLSLDGLAYFTYKFPVTPYNNNYCITISEDGQRIFYSDFKQYLVVDTDNAYACTDIYYSDLNNISVLSWAKYTCKDSIAAMYTNEHLDGINIICNVNNENLGYSSFRTKLNSVVNAKCSSPDKNNAVFIAVVSNEYACNRYSKNLNIFQDAIFNENETLTTVINDAYTLYTICFTENDIDVSVTTDYSLVSIDGIAPIDESNIGLNKFAALPWKMFAEPFYLVFVKYIVTNSLKVISIGANVHITDVSNNQYLKYDEFDIFYRVSLGTTNYFTIGSICKANNGDELSLTNQYCVMNKCYYKVAYRYRKSQNAFNEQSDNRIANFIENYCYRLSVNGNNVSFKIVFNYNDENQVICGMDNIFLTTENLFSIDISDYVKEKYTYNVSSNININNSCFFRYNYPYASNGNFAYSSDNTFDGKYVNIITNQITTNIANIYFCDDGKNVLSDKWYYYSDTLYLLLKLDGETLYPLYLSTDGKTFVYYNATEEATYTNDYNGIATVDLLIPGDKKYVAPTFAEDFITTTIAVNNLLYQSIDKNNDDPEHPLIYFPINSKVTFVDEITNLVVFSQTSLGVFLEDLVYEYQYDTGNGVYILTPTKLQLGCKKGADIVTGYDGNTIFVTTLKGLAGLNYQDFVQSTEQVYTYLTDSIMDLYDSFKSDGKIKLYQYKDWIFVYRQDCLYFYIFDVRSSTWWKWTNPYTIQKILYDGDNLLLLTNEQIAKYDFENEDFFDFVGTRISWKIRSQKLHFDAPNNYKHIRQLNIITTENGTELRYKLKFVNYRNLNNLSDIDTVLFDIDQLTTLIKRVNFIKTNAFQFEISDDDTDDRPKYFETPDIVIKYRITEDVR